MKLLDKEEVDLFVEANDEGDLCRVAEIFDENVGPLVNLLDTKDVDLFVDADDEDEVSSVAEMFNEEVG